MNLPRIAAASTFLALAALAGLSAAQPLPHGSLNRAELGVELTGPSRALLSTGSRACDDGLCLEVTLALADPDNPAQCGTQTELAVTIGDAVNICYQMTNHTALTLNFHTLVDSIVGVLFADQMHALAPHQTRQHNRVITAGTHANATHGVFTSTWTAGDVATGYEHQVDSEPFIDISATGSQLNLSDDGAAPIPMPFPIEFYGIPVQQLCIGNNGGIYIDPASCSGFPYANRELPATNLVAPSVLPFWDDLIMTGMIYHESLGNAPERRFVVSWHDKANFGNTGNPGGQHGVTFQVVFHEADGSFHYNYHTTTFGGDVPPAAYDHGASATVGVQRDHAIASQFSHDTPSLSDGLSLHWQPIAQQAFTVAAQAELDVGAPVILLSPDPSAGLQASVEIGSGTSAPMVIGNFGDRPLHWRLTPPESNQHFPGDDRSAVARLQAVLAQTVPVPVRVGERAGGSDPVPAYALRNGAPPLRYVSFDVLDAVDPKEISSGQVFMFAADFVEGDLTRQYTVTGFDGNSRLYEISTATGDATLIGSVGLPTTVQPYGAAWDPIGNAFYITAVDFGSNTSHLYTVDLATAQLTPVGSIPNSRVSEIAIDSSGLMYGVNVLSSQLLAIDRHTGDTQMIGSLGISLNFSQGLDFDDRTGILYLMAFNGQVWDVFTVDTGTGAATWAGPSFGEVGGFSIATVGAQCDYEDTAPWLGYDIDAGTVAADPSAYSTVQLQFDASDLVEGVHTANLCIFSNDPNRPRVVLPVELTVTKIDDTIFSNGFEVP